METFMERLNLKTKKAQKYFEMYQNSKHPNLLSCYKTRPSQNKLIAEAQIRTRMAKTSGHDFRILSHSDFFFTCGYMTAADNLVIDTPTHTYFIHIPF